VSACPQVRILLIEAGATFPFIALSRTLGLPAVRPTTTTACTVIMAVFSTQNKACITRIINGAAEAARTRRRRAQRRGRCTA
jgi:hypothetical protein